MEQQLLMIAPTCSSGGGVEGSWSSKDERIVEQGQFPSTLFLVDHLPPATKRLGLVDLETYNGSVDIATIWRCTKVWRKRDIFERMIRFLPRFQNSLAQRQAFDTNEISSSEWLQSYPGFQKSLAQR